MRPFVAADWLSSRGIKVEFVAPYLSIGDTMDGNMRAEMLAKLTEQGVSFHPGYEAISWDDPSIASTLRCRNVQTAEDLTFDNVDGFVATVGSTSWNPLESLLRGQVPELHVIGDANLPQTVEAATYQGARIGRLI